MDALVKQQAWAEFRHSLLLLGALGRSWKTLVQLTWRWLLWNGLMVGALLTFLATTTAFIPVLTPTNHWLRRLYWLSEVVSHFQPHYLLILMSVTILFLLRKRYKRGATTAVFCLFNLFLILPLYLPVAAQPDITQTYRLLSLNVYAQNEDYANTLALIGQTQPDIIVLIDALEGWRNAMLPLLNDYPFSNHYHSSNYHGTIIYSRHPFANKAGVRPLNDKHRPAALAHLDLDGQTFTLLAAHPLSPRNIGRTEKRNEQLVDFANTISSYPNPRMLIGDLNTTPWSPIFREVLTQSGMQNSSQGFGLQATWPTRLGAWGIPIDHAIISPDITIQQLERGPDVGSDHYPLLIDFALAPSH